MMLLSEYAFFGIAARLLSEDGENPEYDRAITELTCDALGFPMEMKEQIAYKLRERLETEKQVDSGGSVFGS